MSLSTKLTFRPECDDCALASAAVDYVQSQSRDSGDSGDRSKLVGDVIIDIIEQRPTARSDVLLQLHTTFPDALSTTELFGIVCSALRKEAYGLVEPLLDHDARGELVASDPVQLHRGRKNLRDQLFVATMLFTQWDARSTSSAGVQGQLIRTLEFVSRYNRPERHWMDRSDQSTCVRQCLERGHVRVLEWLVCDKGFVDIATDDKCLDDAMAIRSLNQILIRQWGQDSSVIPTGSDSWSVSATSARVPDPTVWKDLSVPKYEMVGALMRLGARAVFPNGHRIQSLKLARRLGLALHERLLLEGTGETSELREELVGLVRRFELTSLRGIARQIQRGATGREAIERFLRDRWDVADAFEQPICRQKDLIFLGGRACYLGLADAVRAVLDIARDLGLDESEIFQLRRNRECFYGAVRKGHVEALRACLERSPIAPYQLSWCLATVKPIPDDVKRLFVEFGARVDASDELII